MISSASGRWPIRLKRDWAGNGSQIEKQLSPVKKSFDLRSLPSSTSEGGRTIPNALNRGWDSARAAARERPISKMNGLSSHCMHQVNIPSVTTCIESRVSRIGHGLPQCVLHDKGHIPDSDDSDISPARRPQGTRWCL
jgi:hypothetical protein